MANTRNKLLTALLTIIALFIGQKAFATEYTLTYTVHLYVGQNGLPYVYPGYGPCDNTIVFSGPSSDHYVPSCSVFSHTHAGQYQNCNLSPSINGFTLDLDDGIRLQAVWENGFIGWYNDPDNPDNNNNYKAFNVQNQQGQNIPVTYKISCDSYYITHIKMESEQGNSSVAVSGSQFAVPGGAFPLGIGSVFADKDVNLLKSHESYYQMTYQEDQYFCKLIITISDVPRNFPITYYLHGGSANNPDTYTVESTFTLNNPTRPGYNFTGWTGTGLDTLTQTVTIPQYSMGNRQYSANWEAILWTGTGTAQDPFVISCPSQLDLLALRLNSGTGDDDAPNGYSGVYFKLDDDLVYEGTDDNYTPIGTSSRPFKGHFDGNGKTISNIHATNDNSAVGLFGYVDGGTIENCRVFNSTFTSSNNVAGVIVGSLVNGTLSYNYYHDCTVNGETANVGCGSPAGDITEDDGVRNSNILALAEGITTSSPLAFTYNNATYYAVGTEIALTYEGTIPDGQFIKYYVNGSAIAGNSFEMPAAEVTVWFAIGQPVGDAWSDDFEGTACGWNLINNATGNNWAWGEATNHGGTHALYISNDDGTTYGYTTDNNEAMATVYATKLFHFTQGKYTFSYDWKARGYASYDYLRVLLVPASNALSASTGSYFSYGYTSLPTGWIAVDGGSGLNLVSEWQSKSAITNVPDGDYFMVLAWHNYNWNGVNPPAAVDNVGITRFSCGFDVNDLAVHALTTSTATLTWDDCGAEQWQVCYADNSNFESPTTTMVNTPAYTMEGLQSGTVYFTKVRPVCNGTDYGAWSDVLSFHSECEALTDYPYSENFDSYTGATSGTTNNLPGCWHYINTTTINSCKGYPIIYNSSSSSHTVSNSLWFYYLQSTYNDPQDQYAILPPMEDLNGKQLTFYAKAYNTNSSIKVGMMTDPTDITTFVEIVSFTPPTNAYKEYFCVLGTGNYVAFMMEAAKPTTSCGIYIDDITIESAPCLKPTTLVASNPRAHNVTLNWTVNDPAQTTWEVQVATDAGFSENAVLHENIDTHVNYLLTDLNPDTRYYVRVRANCGDVDGVSPWSNPTNFTTTIPCPAPTSFSVTDIQGQRAKLKWTGTSDSYYVSYRTAAYTTNFNEHFDNKLNNYEQPDGWMVYRGLVDNVLNGTDTLGLHIPTPANFGWYLTSNGLGQYNEKLGIRGTGVQNWLVTPEIAVNGNYSLTFTLALTGYNNSNPISHPDGQADDRFVVLVYADNAWTKLREWNNAGSSFVYNTIATTGEEVVINLSSYANKTVKIAFYGESTNNEGANSGSNDIHIDDVAVGVYHAPGAWETVAGDESPFVITGLTPETGYDAKVQGNCGDVDGLSSELKRSFKTTTLTTLTKDIAGYTDDESGWYLIASPMAGSTAVTDVTDLTSNTYDLYRFNQAASGTEWQNYQAHNSDAENPFNALVNGQGYLYANSGDPNNNPNTVTLSFTGDPVLGNTYDVTLVKDDNATLSGWNLVGNPFRVNAYIDRPFYIINGGNEIIAASGVRDYIEPMEGVFVEAANDKETMTFSTTAPNPDPGKGSMLSIDLSQGHGVIDRAIVSFDESRRLSKFQMRDNSTKLYIPQDGKDYALVTVDTDAPRNVSTEIPVYFKAKESGEYTLTVSTTFHSSLSTLHLIDNVTGADIDLLQTPSYTFSTRSDDYPSRFKLVFSANENENEDFAFISDGNIIVNGTGTLQVIDMLGHVLVSHEVNSSLLTPHSSLSPGVYVLRLVNDENVKTQKIVIK